MAQNVGHVIQIAGPAVDMQFADGTLPPIYQALEVVSDGYNVPTPINVIRRSATALGRRPRSLRRHVGRPTAWCAA